MIPVKPHRRPGRTLLSVLSLAVSFGMLVSLISVSQGIEGAAEGKLGDQPRDMIISSQGIDPSIDHSHSRSEKLQDDGNFSASMPVLTLVGRLGFSSKASLSDPFIHPPERFSAPGDLRTETAGLVGLVPGMAEPFISEEDSLLIRNELFRYHDWFEEPEDPFHRSNYTTGFTGSMLIEDRMADRYHLEKGDPVFFIDRSGEVSASFRVIGTFGTSLMGDGLSSDLVGGIAIVHLGELQYLTGNHHGDMATAIYLDLEEDRKDRETQKEIAISLERQFPGLQVTSKEMRLYRLEDEIAVLSVFSVVVGAVTVVIGLFFLSSIMMMSVEERRREMMILRAIGISRRSIFMGVIAEALLVASIGSVLGLVPGFLGTGLLDSYMRSFYGVDIPFTEVSPPTIIISIALTLLCAFVFSIIPAVRAVSIGRLRDLA